MAESAADASLDVELKMNCLNQFWTRYNRQFSLWWLQKSKQQQEALLLRACPDMPASPAQHELRPSDILLPELNLEALSSAGGRVLVVLFATRLSALDTAFNKDITLFNEYHASGNMLISVIPQQLSSVPFAFIDPLDSSESVQSLGAAPSDELKAQLVAYLQSGRVVHANVWFGVKLRRAALVAFHSFLVQVFEEEFEEELVPSYAELYRGEVLQLKQSGML